MGTAEPTTSLAVPGGWVLLPPQLCDTDATCQGAALGTGVGKDGHGVAGEMLG